MTQLREEIYFTKGRVIVRGKIVRRGETKKADYLLYYKPGIPIAVIEAKDNNYALAAAMQQALEYAAILDVPFAYSSNGNAFLEHDRTSAKIIPSPPKPATGDSCDHAHAQGAPVRMIWARLLKRVFDIDIERCTHCGVTLKIIAAIEDPPVIARILAHLGLPTRAPPRAPARRIDLFQAV